MPNRFRDYRDWPAWTDRVRWALSDPEDDPTEDGGESFEVDDQPPYGPEDDPTEGEAGPYGDDIPF